MQQIYDIFNYIDHENTIHRIRQKEHQQNSLSTKIKSLKATHVALDVGFFFSNGAFSINSSSKFLVEQPSGLVGLSETFLNYLYQRWRCAGLSVRDGSPCTLKLLFGGSHTYMYRLDN